VQTGTYISGAGHLLVIGWAMLAGVFDSHNRLPPLEFTEVTVMSGVEFAALTNTPVDRAPVTQAAQPVAPRAPDAATAPSLPQRDAPAPAPATPLAPDALQQARPDPAPDLSALAPVPRADVTDVAPTLPVAPAPEGGAPLLNLNNDAPKAQAAPRVAPAPAPPPPPEAEIADSLREAVQPDALPQVQAPQPPQTAAAPQEAAPEIVTEAEQPGARVLAPSVSLRPKSRPAVPVVAAAPPAAVDPVPPRPVAEPPEAVAGDGLADAIATAVEEATAPPETNTETIPETAPSDALVLAGPPLTGGEKDALRISVQRCWNVGSLSTDALRVTVMVGVTMKQDATPDAGTIRLLEASGGNDAATQQAFEAARRALIRCGADGFALPAEKYAQWRDIEIVFNPEKMRIK
jgi:hypothetical protein